MSHHPPTPDLADHPILEGLNPPQREAVLANDGPVLILAGAGSGKTRALTRKIAWLVREEGVRPWEILAVTFTNKAASEMRLRCAQLLGEHVEFPWLGTFHRVGVHILRRHGEQVGVPPSFVIYDQSDQKAMVNRCIRQRGIDKLKPKPVQEFINAAKQRALGPDALGEADELEADDRFLDLYRLYDQEMKAAGALDFGDLLMRPLELMRNHPEVAQTYRSTWRHVLVDEFQDTNQVQYDLLKEILNPDARICVVGDDDQSIYRWRGAEVENILHFDRDFPGTTVVKLEQNYRSSGHILAVAREVIARNTRRHPKTLWTAEDDGALVRIYAAPTDTQEAAWVIRRIEELRRDTPLRELAVFYRTNAQSRAFEDVLRKSAIPHRVIGGLRFYDRAEVKDIVAYLRLLVNPADAVSFERIINTPTRGIGAATVTGIREHAATHGQTMWEACCVLSREGTRGQQRKLAPFVALIEEMGRLAQEESALSVAHQILLSTAYLAQLEVEDTAEAESRIQNLQELLNAIEEHGEATGDGSLRSFLEEVALVTDLERQDLGDDTLSLMTVHTAKGLEFDAVFLTGLEYGLFPHFNSIEEPGGIEEERRLAYVAMTRPRRRLFLSYAGQRRRFGTMEAALPSPFLDDLPPGSVERDQSPRTGRPFLSRTGGSTSWRGASDRASPDPFDQTMPDYEDFSQDERSMEPGATVFHPTFGQGRVLRLDGHGREARAQVRFDGGEVRRIVARFLTVV